MTTRRNIRTNKFGFETISTIGAVLRRNLPNDIKNSDSLIIFKHRIKQWTPVNCKKFHKEVGIHMKATHMYAPFPFLRSDLCSFFILQYLQVLNKTENKFLFFSKTIIKKYILVRLIVVQCNFYFLSKVCYNNNNLIAINYTILL